MVVAAAAEPPRLLGRCRFAGGEGYPLRRMDDAGGASEPLLDCNMQWTEIKNTTSKSISPIKINNMVFFLPKAYRRQALPIWFLPSTTHAKRMSTSSEAARGTPSSSETLHTPASASAMLPPMFTPTSGTAIDGAPISSRPRATTSLFGSASSQRASQRSADEDARDDGQDPEYLLPSSQDETETRYAISPFDHTLLLAPLISCICAGTATLDFMHLCT